MPRVSRFSGEKSAGIPKQHQDLIRQMSFERADRIADELRLKLGIRRASSRQKYMVRPEHRIPGKPGG